jgi:hypothetical protein
MSNKKGFSSISSVLEGFRSNEDKYISREFQKYAYDLAKELNDLSHKSLYMRLAKNTPRALLENARNFVKDAYKVESKGKLFMWKLSQLRQELKDKSKISTS